MGDRDEGESCTSQHVDDRKYTGMASCTKMMHHNKGCREPHAWGHHRLDGGGGGGVRGGVSWLLSAVTHVTMASPLLLVAWYFPPRKFDALQAHMHLKVPAEKGRFATALAFTALHQGDTSSITGDPGRLPCG